MTVSGSDAYGLPTAPDSDVIVALLHLTKTRNDFTDPTVPFSRYELLELLGWPDTGQYYRQARRVAPPLGRRDVVLRRLLVGQQDQVLGRCEASTSSTSVVIFDQDVRRDAPGEAATPAALDLHLGQGLLRRAAGPTTSSSSTWASTSG